MANPAALLHGLLSEWRSGPNETPNSVRMSRYGNDSAALDAAHRAAMQHISALVELVAGLEAMGERVGPYLRCIPRWQAWVMAFPYHWGGTNNTTAMNDQDALDILEGLAGLLDREVPEYSEDLQIELCERVTQIKQLLVDDQELPQDLRRHLHSLIAHVDYCLNDYAIVGDFELKAASERLMATAFVAATQRSGLAERWAAVVKDFVFPTVSNVAASAITGGATWMLTLGG